MVDLGLEGKCFFPGGEEPYRRRKGTGKDTEAASTRKLKLCVMKFEELREPDEGSLVRTGEDEAGRAVGTGLRRPHAVPPLRGERVPRTDPQALAGQGPSCPPLTCYSPTDTVGHDEALQAGWGP